MNILLLLTNANFNNLKDDCNEEVKVVSVRVGDGDVLLHWSSGKLYE
jgi:hypothetical protein